MLNKMKFVLLMIVIIGAYSLKAELSSGLNLAKASLQSDTGLLNLLTKSHINRAEKSLWWDWGWDMWYDPYYYSYGFGDYYWYPYYDNYPWFGYYDVFWRDAKTKPIPSPEKAKFGDVNKELSDLKKEVFGNEQASTEEIRKKEKTIYSTVWLLRQLKLTKIIALENQIEEFKNKQKTGTAKK